MRALVWTIGIVLALLLSGCATAPRGMPLPSESTPADSAPPAESPDPIGLIGLWRVSDAEGAAADTWLRLDGVEATLWRECGYMFGGWVAGDGAFVADLYAAHQGCMEGDGIPEIEWLDGAVGYARDGEGWALLSADGSVVARLAIDGAPPLHTDIVSTYNEQPVVDAEARARLSSTPLPEGLVPASADELIGRWVPAAEVVHDPHVIVDADGTWTGSDGCNGSRGRWLSPRAGLLLATSGPSTLIGCEGSAEPTAFGGARGAGFDGETLVLFDPAGVEVARLVRG